MAHHIPEAVDRSHGSVLAPPAREELWLRAVSAIGTGQGDGGNASAEHDRYLDELYAS